jgi:hypothetical protein
LVIAPFAVEHASQAPVHGTSQHFLSASGQLPLAQSVPVAQVLPCLFLQAPFASHVQGMLAQLPLVASHAPMSSPLFTAEDLQVPSTAAPFATEHASHGPLQSLSQHFPSTHLPPAHSEAAPQVLPCLFLHNPLLLQVHGIMAQLPLVASHAPMSSPLFTASDLQVPSTAAPFAIEHAAQGPLQSLSQQTPSTHLLLAQSAGPAHVSPSFFLQLPALSQEHLPPQPPKPSSQVPLSCLLLTALARHTPLVAAPFAVEHAEQAPVHAVSQHRKSAAGQLPLMQSPLTAHTAPFFDLHDEAPSHAHGLLLQPLFMSHLPATSMSFVSGV